MAARVPEFDLRGIAFKSRSPVDVPLGEWEQVIAVEQAANRAVFPGASDEQIAVAIGAQDGTATYRDTRIDPSLVEQFAPNQEWTDGVIVTAHDGPDIVGLLTAYNNVSGSEHARQIKKTVLFPLKRYAYTREIAVDKNYQHRGIAHALGEIGLSQFSNLQPASAYVYRETPKVDGLLLSIGYKKDTISTTPVEVYPGHELYMDCYKGRVALIRYRLWRLPGAGKALRMAKRSLEMGLS